MKTIIKEIALLGVAFLLTGSMANAMAPPAEAVTSTKPAVIKIESKPVTPIVTQTAPVKELTWQDNPNHCDSTTQYIAAQAPFTCIDKEIPTSTHTSPQTSSQSVTGTHSDWMAAAGIAPSDYRYVDYIVSHESGWTYTAINASSGATGLCQALPGSKMASAGSDWATNPITQLKWCNGYAAGRYGSWYQSYIFWESHRYW